MRQHGIQQLNAVENIVDIILHGNFYGFTHIGIRRKMHDGIDSIFCKAILQVLRITDIAPVKFAPFYSLPVTVDEVVKGDGVVALKIQLFAAVGPDISGSAGNQYI